MAVNKCKPGLTIPLEPLRSYEIMCPCRLKRRFFDVYHWIVSDMPARPSGKIMRRVLGAISSDKDVGDVTTLANPGIVEEIKAMPRK